MSKKKANYNGDFTREYNILDDLCKQLSPKGSKTRSGIHNLEEALKKSDYETADELGYFRKYKNIIVSHRASKKMPSTPYDYVCFIKKLRLEVENNRKKYQMLFAQVEQADAKHYTSAGNRSKTNSGRSNKTTELPTERTVERWPSPNETGEWEYASDYNYIVDAPDVFWTAYFPTIISCVFFLLVYSFSTISLWTLIVTGPLLVAIPAVSHIIEVKYNEYWEFDKLLYYGKHSFFSILILILVDTLTIGVDFIFKRNIFLICFSGIVILILIVFYLINYFFMRGGDYEIFFQPYTINIMATMAISVPASLCLIPPMESYTLYVFIIHGSSVACFALLLGMIIFSGTHLPS